VRGRAQSSTDLRARDGSGYFAPELGCGPVTIWPTGDLPVPSFSTLKVADVGSSRSAPPANMFSCADLRARLGVWRFAGALLGCTHSSSPRLIFTVLKMNIEAIATKLCSPQVRSGGRRTPGCSRRCALIVPLLGAEGLSAPWSSSDTGQANFHLLSLASCKWFVDQSRYCARECPPVRADSPEESRT
jgi:hypothetical protein